MAAPEASDRPSARVTPDEFFAFARRVLFVHAHPDDETLWAGNLMAELVDRGARVSLVTTNRGELGQVVDPELAHVFGTDSLGPHRARELEASLERLGVTDHAWLGTAPARAAGLPDREYRDSGMRWVTEGVAGPDLEAAADLRCFTSAPMDEATADLAAFAAARTPDVIITYDANGGYGHPDHVRAHLISVAVGRATGAQVWAIAGDPAARRVTDADVWFDLPHQADRIRSGLEQYRSQLIMRPDGRVQHEDGFSHEVPVGVGLTRIV
ncbi:PIG-L family deacetylase [Pseudoclavibacter endophyticus]|nr:PIG-L family deacetylase [Pseudoclavibacter endophyticus]